MKNVYRTKLVTYCPFCCSEKKYEQFTECYDKVGHMGYTICGQTTKTWNNLSEVKCENCNNYSDKVLDIKDLIFMDFPHMKDEISKLEKDIKYCIDCFKKYNEELKKI